MSNTVYISLIKHVALCLVWLTLINKGYTQSKDKAQWYYTVSSNTAKVGDTLELYFRVEIAHNWYIHAIDQEPLMAPPTEPYFQLKDCELVGNPGSLHEVTVFNEAYQKYTKLYAGISGGFKQKIRITGKTPVVQINIHYALCSMDTKEQWDLSQVFKIQL